MSEVIISDLQASGADLLLEEESYLNEISSEDTYPIIGGISTSPVCAVVASVYLSYKAGQMAREIHDGNHTPFSPL